MSKDNDKKSNDGGFGAVFLIIVVLVAMAFVGGGDNPLDRIADLIMICTWALAIGFLALVIFFVMALCLQTAMSDLYESLLEDFEHSPIRSKIEHYKALFDKKILGRIPQKPVVSTVNKPLKSSVKVALEKRKAQKKIKKEIKEKERKEAKEDDLFDFDDFQN